MSWFALVAEFPARSEPLERRSSPRRRMRLESVLSTRRPMSKAVVLDLSEAGMMLHAYDDLAKDDIFEVLLPGVGAVEAQVVWQRNALYGCKFLAPVSPAMISAALLTARPASSESEG